VKKFLLVLLIVLPVYLLAILYFLDKSSFACPIVYKRDIIIRSDSRGDGFFAANRRGARIHEGIDLFARIGTLVLAGRSGRVIAATQNRGMGNFIIIRHSHNIISIYGHLLEIHVAKNEFVHQGQVIGSVGKTGNASNRNIQPHLHFEIRKNGIPQDPLEYLE